MSVFVTAGLCILFPLSLCALDKNADNSAYVINNADDLMSFASLVNGGEESANGELAADIDLTGCEWVPIGKQGAPYTGKFDGKCHTVDNLKIVDLEAEYLGFFGVVSGDADIRNFILGPGSEVSGARFCGGIAGGSNGTGDVYLTNLGNEATVKTIECNAGGIIGVSMDSGCQFHMVNCYNAGDIVGGYESGALTGWFGYGSECINCYNSGNVTGAVVTDEGNRDLWDADGVKVSGVYNILEGGQGILVTSEEVTSGALCFMLNGNVTGGTNFYQTIGSDSHPVPFSTHEAVYAHGSFRCDHTPVEISYDNNAEGEGIAVADHDFNSETHHCNFCGALDTSFMEKVDGCYEIGTAEQFFWFASYVNEVDNTVDGKLTEDINLSDKNWTPIGTSSMPYTGTFDGCCHYISEMTVDGDWFQGLFGLIGEGAEICNLIIDETCSVHANVGAGAIAGGTEGDGVITIRNCGNLGSVVCEEHNAAAIVGTNDVGEAQLKIYNCFNAGPITCHANQNSAVFCTWFGENSEVVNCYHIGSMDLDCTQSGQELCRPASNVATIERIYTTSEDCSQGILVTDAEVKSGHLAFLLNGEQSGGTNFYQNIGEDDYPIPFNTHKAVYAHGLLRCDSTPLGTTYDNDAEGGEFTVADHEFNSETHHCDFCGALDTTFMEKVDGCFEIENAEQFFWFASYVNEVDNTVNGKLMDDILLSDKNWTPIGTSSMPYTGTFDGCCHYIGEMTVDGDWFQGLFGLIGEGAEICSLIIDETCSVHANVGAGAIAGGTEGDGVITIRNCGNLGSVVCEEHNAAAIVGTNDVGEAQLKIYNCFNAGSITCHANQNSAVFCTWFGENSEVVNCYHIGSMDISCTQSGQELCRPASNVAIERLYTTSEECPQGILITEDDVKSGNLAFLLNGEQSGGTNFYQNIGEDDYPIPFNTHKAVYAHGLLRCDNTPLGVSYDNNAEGEEFSYADHEFNGETHRCNFCGTLDTSFMTMVDGSFEIENAEQFFWFASYVNEVDNTVNGKLKEDINLSGKNWTPAGTSSMPYVGTFDGCCHYISEMTVDGDWFQGLFGLIGEGAEICNLIIDETCSVHANVGAGAIAGGTEGDGVITIRNCGNLGSVVCEEHNAAAIIGTNDVGEAQLKIYNCFNAGSITCHANQNSAVFCTWFGENSEVVNCYHIGSMNIDCTQSGQELCRPAYNVTTERLYTTSEECPQGILVTDDDVKSGRLAYLLNGEENGGTNFYQNIGEDAYPVPFNTHEKVYKSADDTYTNDGSSVNAMTKPAEVVEVFAIDGIQRGTTQKGINIVRMSNGTCQKVLVR